MKEEIKISIFGDVCPDRQFNKFFQYTDRIDFGNIAEYIRNSDIVIANLEAPASEKGAPIKKTGPCLHCKNEDLSALKEIGIDIVSLANNHILDYGEDALKDTIETADDIGLAHFGAGKNKNDAAKAYFVVKNEFRIGMLSFAEEEFSIAGENSYGANLFDPYVSLDSIKEAKEDCDLLIVLYHGGIEHYELPSPLLKKKCRKMAEYGADLVLCQHSHCIGAVESFNNSVILYGQGNSYFGKREGNQRWNNGFLLDVILSDKQFSVDYKLITAKEDKIEFASEEESKKRVDEMLELSKAIDNDAFLEKSWAEYCKTQEAMDLAYVFGWGRILNKLNRMFNNKIAKFILTNQKRMITMNLIRCDAHREVVQTILENSYYE